MEAIDELAQKIAQDLDALADVRSMRDVIDDVELAYDVQDKLRDHLGAFCGRKIAMNTSVLMKNPDVVAPLFANVVGKTSKAGGCVLNISDYSELALEPEFAAVLAKEVPANTKLSQANLFDFVEHFYMAFEILDKRNVGTEVFAPTFVANNIFNAGCVLGDVIEDRAKLVAGEYQSQFRNERDVFVDGKNTAPQNPLDACLMVMNHVSARGHMISAGEVILCGAHHPPMVVKESGEFVFSLSSGEAVNLSISD